MSSPPCATIERPYRRSPFDGLDAATSSTQTIRNFSEMHPSVSAPGFGVKKIEVAPLNSKNQGDSFRLRLENHPQRDARWWHRACSISSTKPIHRPTA